MMGEQQNRSAMARETAEIPEATERLLGVVSLEFGANIDNDQWVLQSLGLVDGHDAQPMPWHRKQQVLVDLDLLRCDRGQQVVDH